MYRNSSSKLLSRVIKQFQSHVPSRSVTSSVSKPLADKSIDSSQESPTANVAEQFSSSQMRPWIERMSNVSTQGRLPRSVQAIYMRPLRKKAEYGLPVCDLQLRSYSVRNVEFFADFALRAAYYLKLPVSGPVPLPRIVERWTFPRSNFVHKKSQENFERITLRRLIQIKDGNPDVVQTWLAFLRKHAFYGIGMKANVWEHESLDVIKQMDKSVSEAEKSLRPHFERFGQRQGGRTVQSAIPDILSSERFTLNKSPLTTVRSD